MSARVVVLAPSRDIETALRAAAEDAGFASTGEPLPQELCSLLYRDSDAIGVIRALNSGFAAVTCRDFRRADVKNLLFVLLDATAWDSASAALILRCGADDVQPAPIHGDEFVARLKALVRRGTYNDHLFITMPGCVFDAETGNAENGIRTQHLTGAEARLLTALALDPSRVFSKDDLMDHMYGGEDEPEKKIVDVLVCKLRRKLRRKLIEMNDGLDVIETNWGRGYRFIPQGFPPVYRNRVRSAR